MSSGKVFYLISGPSHLPYLVASIHSLRTKAQFDGEVVVFAWPESSLAAKAMSLDKSLDITLKEREPRSRGHNCHFLEKIHLMEEFAGTEGALFIDADTLPVGPVDAFFSALKYANMVTVQFSNWTTQKRIIQNRLQKIKHVEECKDDLASCFAESISSPNNGVLACRSNSACLARWAKLTTQVYETVFIPDEVCLHPVVASDAFKEEGIMFSGDSGYNTSPKYQHPDLKDTAVKIWHFHGDSNVRPEKSQRGFDLWWPVFRHCLKENVGNVQHWFVPEMNKWINQFHDNLL